MTELRVAFPKSDVVRASGATRTDGNGDVPGSQVENPCGTVTR
jgi:hypothetical protein